MAQTKRIQILDENGNTRTITLPEAWYGGSAAPGVNDDENDGFAVGSLWVRITGGNPTFYVCTDPAHGAAAWALLPALADQVLSTEYTPAQTVLVAVADQDPLPVTLGANTVLGRAGGDAKALTVAETRSIIKAASEANFDDIAAAGTIGEDRLAVQVTPRVLANEADGATSGQMPILFRKSLAGGANVTNIVVDRKVRVIDAWFVAQAGGGGAATVVVGNGAAAISDVISLGIAVGAKDIVRAAEIDIANQDIALGGSLRFTTVDPLCPALEAYVLAIPIV